MLAHEVAVVHEVARGRRILGRDVYGWFERVARGIYSLSDRGRADVARFSASGLLPALEPPTTAFDSASFTMRSIASRI